MRYAIYLLLLLAAPAFAADPVYSWRSRADDPDRIYLYRDGKQIGGWCYREKQYRPYDGEAWGPATTASPVKPPDRTPPAPRDLSGAPLYVGGPLLNATYFAVFETHPDLKAELEADGFKRLVIKELTTSGSLRLFLSESAKFAEKLKEEKFAKSLLAMIYFEIEDDDPHWQPLAGNGAFQSIPMFWKNNAPNPTDEARGVLLMLNHKVRKAPDKDKVPVTAHCSFVFMAMKEGKGFAKTLSYDVYLEKVEQRKDSITYPWKVKNVEYK
jgi:hypothetical protein